MDISALEFVSFHSDQGLASLQVLNDEVAIAIELSFLIFQKDHVQDAWYFGIVVIESFFSLRKVRDVPEVHPERFVRRVAMDHCQIRGNFLIVHVTGIIFIFIVVLRPSELFFELVLLVVRV